MVALNVPETGAVYLDANCVIYSIERVAPFHEMLELLMRRAGSAEVSLVTSELTLLECLVKPLRDRNDKVVALFRAVLTASNEVRMLPITRSVIELAAKIRADHALRTPDALHAATAIEARSTLISAEAAFGKVQGLKSVILQR